MPRVYPPRRTFTGVRLPAEGLAAVDVLAQGDGVSRSEMIRQLLSEAIAARQKAQPGRRSMTRRS